MALCKNTITGNTVAECAEICDQWNTLPVPKFTYSDFKLIQISDFFDSNFKQNRQFRWNVTSDDYPVYTFGWGNLNANVSELSNGSTYGALVLGYLNQNMINFLKTLPHTFIPQSIPFILTLEVKDCDGFSSSKNSNKYKFSS